MPPGVLMTTSEVPGTAASFAPVKDAQCQRRSYKLAETSGVATTSFQKSTTGRVTRIRAVCTVCTVRTMAAGKGLFFTRAAGYRWHKSQSPYLGGNSSSSGLVVESSNQWWVRLRRAKQAPASPTHLSHVSCYDLQDLHKGLMMMSGGPAMMREGSGARR